jgi:hypothetical protein
MLSCVGACLKQIPWWAWIVLAVAGAIFALIAFLTGGLPIAWLPLWLQAVLAFLGPFALTVANCVRGCLSAPAG